MTVLSLPDDIALLEFFGEGPSAAEPADGFWAYTISDPRGVMLEFSFNVLEGSVQTRLEVGGLPLSVVSHECAESIGVEAGDLVARFRPADTKTELRISLRDHIECTWSTLLLAEGRDARRL